MWVKNRFSLTQKEDTALDDKAPAPEEDRKPAAQQRGKTLPIKPIRRVPKNDEAHKPNDKLLVEEVKDKNESSVGDILSKNERVKRLKKVERPMSQRPQARKKKRI